MSAPLQRIIATIEAVNDKGVKVDGAWLNFSKYAKPDALAPVQAGQWAELQVDGSGFIRAVIAQAKPAPAEAPDDFVDDEPHAAPLSKDVLIVRQTCIKAAAEFAVNRADIKSADVLKIAECWERWCWR